VKHATSTEEECNYNRLDMATNLSEVAKLTSLDRRGAIFAHTISSYRSNKILPDYKQYYLTAS
jgi:hypothetical protein